MALHTEPANDAAEPARSGRAETTLAGGARLVVEVYGPADADALAVRALDAASIEVGRGAWRIPDAASAAAVATGGYAGIVGGSEPMRDLFRLLERIRTSHATVLISGENGTGKELVAKAIHEQSSRAAKRFVATNCSAFNDNLLESELFGHRRGSFTGAVADKPGLFEVADGGTFFLDEVGDMSPALQVKLLRVLQEGVFLPVGATEHRKVDVRIIAATNRDLASMVTRGTFREDLYYRLHVVALRVPALRERRPDIGLLVKHFLARLAKRDGREKVLTQRALEKLAAHVWPGNVRELENEIERLWVLSGDDRIIGEELLSPAVATAARGSIPPPAPEVAAAAAAALAASDAAAAAAGASLPDAVEALERKMILDGLRRAKGNKTRAAEELGISRRNLIRKVQAYGLEGVAPRVPGEDDDEGDDR